MPTPQELETQKQLGRIVLELRQLAARITALEARRISFAPVAIDKEPDVVQEDIDPEAYFRRFLTMDNG